MNLNIKSMSGVELFGEIKVAPDKSITHRALILAALSNKPVKICHWLQSLDCKQTLAALNALQVKSEPLNTTDILIHGVGLHGLQAADHVLDLGNSGTALRLLTGVLSAQKFSSIVTGDASLRQRPMRRIIEPLTAMGANITGLDGQFAPLQINPVAELTAIEYALPVASAQVKSAILLAGLYASGKSIIHEAIPTRNHTELLLDYMYSSDFEKILQIPGDFSSAAFFIVAASIAPGSDLLLRNVGVNPTRTACITILQQMGADITLHNLREFNNEPSADIRVRSAKLRGIAIPVQLVANAIDEFPILAIAAACADGHTEFRGAAELRHKESDRIAAIAAGLSQLGVQHSVFEDGMIIHGNGKITGAVIDSFGDHRIAMAFIMAGLVAESAVIVQDVGNIATSFPDFVAVAQQAGLEMQTC